MGDISFAIAVIGAILVLAVLGAYYLYKNALAVHEMEEEEQGQDIERP